MTLLLSGLDLAAGSVPANRPSLSTTEAAPEGEASTGFSQLFGGMLPGAGAAGIGRPLTTAGLRSEPSFQHGLSGLRMDDTLSAAGLLDRIREPETAIMRSGCTVNTGMTGFVNPALAASLTPDDSASAIEEPDDLSDQSLDENTDALLIANGVVVSIPANNALPTAMGTGDSDAGLTTSAAIENRLSETPDIPMTASETARESESDARSGGGGLDERLATGLSDGRQIFGTSSDHMANTDTIPAPDSSWLTAMRSEAPVPVSADTRNINSQMAGHDPLLQQRLVMDDEPEAWSSGLSNRILTLVGKEIQEARIHLDPPELGALEIRLSVEQDQTRIQIHATHPQVRDVLEAQSQRLRDALGQQGLQLADFSVTDQGGRSDHRDSSDRSGYGSGGSDAAAGDSDRELPEGDTGPVVVSSHRGLLSTFA